MVLQANCHRDLCKAEYPLTEIENQVNLMNENEKLERAIAALEAQRAILGEGVVDVALVPLREKHIGFYRSGRDDGH
jgi:hypothetical protein